MRKLVLVVFSVLGGGCGSSPGQQQLTFSGTVNNLVLDIKADQWTGDSDADGAGQDGQGSVRGVKFDAKTGTQVATWLMSSTTSDAFNVGPNVWSGTLTANAGGPRDFVVPASAITVEAVRFTGDGHRPFEWEGDIKGEAKSPDFPGTFQVAGHFLFRSLCIAPVSNGAINIQYEGFMCGGTGQPDATIKLARKLEGNCPAELTNALIGTTLNSVRTTWQGVVYGGHKTVTAEGCTWDVNLVGFQAVATAPASCTRPAGRFCRDTLSP